ncbi:MAG: hypothetical protein BWK80_33965 [Desulfobacteraceae bacterium IS3]|nr:MAG: hypothetical protein BWK80_33965 [Desulfobacteraceae bacterium IS3]
MSKIRAFLKAMHPSPLPPSPERRGGGEGKNSPLRFGEGSGEGYDNNFALCILNFEFKKTEEYQQ